MRRIAIDLTAASKIVYYVVMKECFENGCARGCAGGCAARVCGGVKVSEGARALRSDVQELRVV